MRVLVVLTLDARICVAQPPVPLGTRNYPGEVQPDHAFLERVDINSGIISTWPFSIFSDTYLIPKFSACEPLHPPTMAAPQSDPNPSGEPELFHVSLGPTSSNTPTIIYLHGMLSGHLECALVAPYLSDSYHLILVDLNGHSDSAAISPFTIPAMADRVASLIRRRAHNGSAHVIGVSMGGYVALDLARRYPSLVESVFNAGAVPLQDRKAAVWMLSHPSIVWYLFRLSLVWFPALSLWMQSRRGVVISDELFAAMRQNLRWELVRDVLGSMLPFGWKELSEIRPRVLGIAAALGENVEVMRREGAVLREKGNRASRAVVLRKARHPWVLQYPELFARGVRAWVEGKELPEEYEAL